MPLYPARQDKRKVNIVRVTIFFFLPLTCPITIKNTYTLSFTKPIKENVYLFQLAHNEIHYYENQ
ncbi:hypothetical protein C7475_11261 [Chitinophaga sp. S165]|nr:hypothetical protein C7475_11261 [Chitinophaga sp. S165]